MTEPELPSGLMRRLMHRMAELIPSDPESGENARAVQMMRRMLSLRDGFSKAAPRHLVQRLKHQQTWPVTSGAYLVGDPTASVAICTLSSIDLMQPLVKLPGVAIVGRVYTPNLGIEKIILNVTANPSIRFLLLCGKESPVFHPGQALEALCKDGVDAERRIIGAVGPYPVLVNLSLALIEQFRRQVELVSWIDKMDSDAIQTQVNALAAKHKGAYQGGDVASKTYSPIKIHQEANKPDNRFVSLRPGGHRQPLSYDPKGFYVVTLNEQAGEIVVRHYSPENAPLHEMRGHSAEAMLLGLLREDLVSQMSHAGYLGYELGKAEIALRLGLSYEQDQPLRTQSA